MTNRYKWDVKEQTTLKPNRDKQCVEPLRIGALAKYRCERGYKIVGDPLVTCEDAGVWSGMVPECICTFVKIVILSLYWEKSGVMF